jgi:ketosteroid isomerase-like protein
VSTSTASPNATVALKALAALGARDFDALRALLSPDVRLEWPYHPSGEPVVIDGADALIAATRVVEVFQSLDLRVIDVVEQASANRTIIEARSEGTYANGRPSYKNHYIFVLTVRDGKITEWREFYNPLEVMKVAARRARPA